ncbi:MAG: histidine kinase [Candidatus Kaistia colombiensis]|nr:MAG: histidine kinase [Kaistia sp.]
MAEIKDVDVNAPPPSAEALRKAILDERMKEAGKEQQHRSKQNEAFNKFTESFLRDQVSEQEIATVRRLAMNAVKSGKYEALVYNFPSVLCTDGGRAINSADPQWPETLQGKAKQFYDRYLQYAKPQGFRLSAMIIDFPGGIPGDVGFFLSWKSEVV